MTNRKLFAKTLALIALIFGIAASIVIWNSDRVRAFNPQPDPPAFGLISLNPGQSLRLNVVNRLAATTDSERLAHATRHAMLGFNLYRADGRLSPGEVPLNPCMTAHRIADRQSCEVTLVPGEAASFDVISATEIGATQVLPEVQDDDSNKKPALVYTLEVRENGRTVHVLPVVQRANTYTGANASN